VGVGAIWELQWLPTAVVLGGKLIWCCYVSVIILSNHITGLEHSRYQRGATKIDCLFRYQIETLLLGDGKQPSPHFPFTRPGPAFTYCICQGASSRSKRRHEISAPTVPSGKEMGGVGGVRAWEGVVGSKNFLSVHAVLPGSSLIPCPFFMSDSPCSLLSPMLPHCLCLLFYFFFF
jgi:hypothetical protein